VSKLRNQLTRLNVLELMIMVGILFNLFLRLILLEKTKLTKLMMAAAIKN
jgi:hypothetical protein